MVAVIFAEGFEEVEAITPVDLMRRAAIDVKMVGLQDKVVTGSHGIKMEMDLILSDLDRNDVEMIVLPGGLKGVANLEASEELKELILWMADNKKLIAAICAAPTYLAKIGVLKNKRCICYPGMENILTENGAKSQNYELVTHDGNIITGQAAGSSISFGLKLIAMMRGWTAAETVREKIHYHGDERSLT